jgi:hypothetical protein
MGDLMGQGVHEIMAVIVRATREVVFPDLNEAPPMGPAQDFPKSVIANLIPGLSTPR